MSYTLIKGLTGTRDSDLIKVTNDPVTLTVTGTQVAAEYFDVQISTDDGTTFVDLYQDGTQVRLSSTNVSVTIYGPGVYRIQKEATTNACGIIVSSPGNP